jgi:hypothetical protein
MPFHQRDIVKVKRPMPDGPELSHPFLIISNERANSHEKNRRYIGVMITHSKERDKFTFELTKDMVDGKLGDKFCQIREHLIVGFSESDISRDVTHYVGKMKMVHFKAVLDQIKEYVIFPDA